MNNIFIFGFFWQSFFSLNFISYLNDGAEDDDDDGEGVCAKQNKEQENNNNKNKSYVRLG